MSDTRLDEAFIRACIAERPVLIADEGPIRGIIHIAAGAVIVTDRSVWLAEPHPVLGFGIQRIAFIPEQVRHE